MKRDWEKLILTVAAAMCAYALTQDAWQWKAWVGLLAIGIASWAGFLRNPNKK
jgi:hypothetical protein